jgi:putative glycosyltransferase (TIGR04372 family)
MLREVYRDRLPIPFRRKVRSIISWMRLIGRRIFFVISTPVAIVAWMLGYRSIRADAQLRIGHLLCESYLGLVRTSKVNSHVKRIIAPFSVRESSNWHITSRLNPSVFRVPVGLPWPQFLRKTFWAHPLLRLPTLEETTRMPCEIYTFFPEDFPPLISSRKNDSLDFSHLAEQLGLDISRPYACLHIREEGYSTIDDQVQIHRNFSLESTLPAVDYLIRNGVQVVRVGGPFGSPMPSNALVIDYAFSNACHPANDYLIISMADYFIGSTSGLYVLAAVHGIPILGTNMSPLNAFGMFGSRTMAIPKLFKSKLDGEIASFSEISHSPAGNSLGMDALRETDFTPVDNTAVEIEEAVKDFLDLVGRPAWELKQSEQLEQEKFRNCLASDAYGIRSSTVIAPSFLARHAALLRIDDVHLRQ